MTRRLVAAVGLLVAGVAVLAHTPPGASITAVAGWALLLAAFITLTTLRDEP